MNWLRACWTQLWLTVVTALVLLALYTSLGRQLLPLLETYQDELVDSLEKLTNQPVALDSITGEWQLFSPIFKLQNLRIGEGEAGIQVAEVSAQLNVGASLFFRQPVFSHITIDRVSAELHRLPNGQFRIGNSWLLPLERTEQRAPDERLHNWLGLQQRIQLRNLQLQYHDEIHSQRLIVNDIDLRNRGSQHLIEGRGFVTNMVEASDGSDPISITESTLSGLYLNAELNGPLWPWDDQQGDVYLKLDKQPWHQWVPKDLPKGISVDEAIMAAEGWLTIVDGDLHRIFVTLDTESFAMTSGGQKLALSDGDISLSGGHLGDDWHIEIRPDFPQKLPLDSLELSSVNLAEGKGWYIDFPSFDAADFLGFVLRYDWFPSKLTEYMANIQPSGRIDRGRLSLIPSVADALAIEFEFTDIESQPYRGIPRLSGASGLLQLMPGIGAASLAQQDLTLHLTDIYEKPWPLREVSGRLLWRFGSQSVRLQLQDLQAQLDGFVVNGRLGMRFPFDETQLDGHLALQLDIAEAPITLQQRLMPDNLDPELIDWLDNGLLEGQLSDVSFVLNGLPGDDSPDNSLSTLMWADIANGRLNYQTGWPEVSDIAGRFTMNLPFVQFQLQQGQTLGGRFVDEGEVLIQPARYDSELVLTANLSGDSGELLSYLQDTPLSELIDDSISDWQATGRHTSSLSLTLPLLSKESIARYGDQIDTDPQVEFVSQLTDTQLRLNELDLDLANVMGEVRFSNESGLQSEKISAQLFGDTVTTSITSIVDDEAMDIRLDASGNAQWSELKPWLDLFLLEPIDGDFQYQGQLLVRNDDRGGIRLRLNSDGVGTSVALPSPLAKLNTETAAINLDLHAREQMEFSFNFRDQLRGLMRFEEAVDDQPLAVEVGQLTYGGQSPQMPLRSGLELVGQVTELVEVDPWWDVWDQMMLLSAEADQQARASGQPVSDNPLQRFELVLDQMDAYQTMVSDTKVSGQFADENWNVHFSNQIAQGMLAIPLADMPLTLNLDYVHWQNEASTLDLLDENGDPISKTRAQYLALDPLIDVVPRDISAIDISLQELYVDTRNLGRWQLSSRPTSTGLQAQIIDSDMRGMAANGTLLWDIIDGEHRTQLVDWTLNSRDIAQVQRAFRLSPSLQASEFKVDASLNWAGSPLAIDTSYLQALSGSYRVRANDGVLNADGTGALNVFGLFNIDTVARRLRLDFSDLREDGFSFDKLRAAADIRNGVMTFDGPLLIDGPGGKFLTSGEADLSNNQLNMELAVTFPLTDSLPLVAFLVGLNPASAGAIYVTEKLIGDELERFSSARYSINGSFEEPEVVIQQAFDNQVDGKKTRSLKDRLLSIFGVDTDK